VSADRDLKMGRALASIPLPELSEGFYARLGEQLEQIRPAARPVSPPAHRRFRVLRVGIAAAVVAVAAAIVAFAVLPAFHGGPETATAAEMLASLNAAVGNARVVRLDILEQRSPLVASASPSSSPGAARSSRPRTVAEQLTLSTAGDVRYTSVRELLDGMGSRVQMRTLETYDSRRHESMRQGDTHLAAGQPPPDPNPYDQPMPRTVLVSRPSWGTTVFSTYLLANFQALSNSLRALLAETDPGTPVQLTTYLGRPAWHTALSEVMPSAKGSGVPVEWSVTVDKETGLLVASELKATSGGALPSGLARSFRVTRIEVDPDLPAGWPRIDPSDVAEVAIFDLGTRFGTPLTVAARAWPTLVLVPKEVPQGYSLTDVATRDYEGMEKTPGDHAKYVVLQRRDPRIYASERTGIDASRQRVQLRYRRGFSSFVISIRPLAGGEGSGGSAGPASGTDDVVLTGGYLKGAKARVWISPYFGGGPTLVTSSDRSKITVTGDLTRQELLDVADSFTAVGDTTKPLPEGYGK
jgi:hypothetical protein